MGAKFYTETDVFVLGDNKISGDPTYVNTAGNIENDTNALAGTEPPNIVSKTTGGGQIFYNKNGITALGPDNHLNALDRNIVFDTTNTKSGAIQLDGNVTITADPPPGMEASQLPLPANAQVLGAVPTAHALSSGLSQTSNGITSPTTFTIETRFGTINMKAGSLVMLIAFENGIAIYNLDDTRRDAVNVQSTEHSFTLAPGQSVVITSSPASSFEQVNPAQLLGYRNIQAQVLPSGLRSFTSEFLVPSCVSAVGSLRKLTQSKHPEARRITAHMYKTSAASLMLHPGRTPFRQMIKPAQVAYAY